MENILFGAILLPILYLKDKMVAVLVRGRKAILTVLKGTQNMKLLIKIILGWEGFLFIAS